MKINIGFVDKMYIYKPGECYRELFPVSLEEILSNEIYEPIYFYENELDLNKTLYELSHKEKYNVIHRLDENKYRVISKFSDAVNFAMKPISQGDDNEQFYSN